MGKSKIAIEASLGKLIRNTLESYLIHAGPVHNFQQVVEGVVQSVGSEGCTGVVQ